MRNETLLQRMSSILTNSEAFLLKQHDHICLPWEDFKDGFCNIYVYLAPKKAVYRINDEGVAKLDEIMDSIYRQMKFDNQTFCKGFDYNRDKSWIYGDKFCSPWVGFREKVGENTVLKTHTLSVIHPQFLEEFDKKLFQKKREKKTEELWRNVKIKIEPSAEYYNLLNRLCQKNVSLEKKEAIGFLRGGAISIENYNRTFAYHLK